MQTHAVIRHLFHHIHFSGETDLLFHANWHEKGFKNPVVNPKDC